MNGCGSSTSLRASTATIGAVVMTTSLAEIVEMSLAEFDAFFREDVDANVALVKAAKIPMQ